MKRAPAPAGIGDVIRLAWPSVLSFACNSAYRVNDQYWIGELGPDAQAALGASFFVLVFNFSFYFLAVAGSLPLIARATGAGDREGRDAAVRHALFLGAGISMGLLAAGTALAPSIPGWLGLDGVPAELSTDYLATIYLFCLPLALAPIVDNIFIGMGHTRIPLLVNAVAVVCNFVLNPCLIYGWGPFEARGMAGAALATCISRGISTVLGLGLMRYAFDVHWARRLAIDWALIVRILRMGLPSALSVAIYSGVYIGMFQLVISGLGRDVMAALSVGFNAFEGVSFPFYLGIAVAGSSLVGRNLGAGEPERALQAVHSVQRVAGVVGFVFALLFLGLGPVIIPLFTTDENVIREALLYISVLAVSQVFVAWEVANEKVLLGAGVTKPIFWISVPGNALRIPLAWFLAVHLGGHAAGVWWAINLTTVLKSALFWLQVRRGAWLPPFAR